MNIARIDAATGVVVNVELASLEWIEANADPDGPFLFVPYDDDTPAGIGDTWEPIGGFMRPARDAVAYTLTADDLTTLGVDLAHADAIVADKVAAVELAAVELAAEATPTKGTR